MFAFLPGPGFEYFGLSDERRIEQLLTLDVEGKYTDVKIYDDIYFDGKRKLPKCKESIPETKLEELSAELIYSYS